MELSTYVDGIIPAISMAPNAAHSPQKKQRAAISQQKTLKRKRDVDDIEDLAHRVASLDPKSHPPVAFTDLPLSSPTLSGLDASHFKTLTTIQARAIPPSLKGVDILGAAKTGSGKTLAFLVPVLENLYRKRWTEYDGLGALILSPTRELAIQIFEVLRKIGRYHTFSAGLVIGGKSLQEERARLGRMNILVATPGRMLQHMDQTSDFEVGNMQILILDEADRIMDMGFAHTVDAIIEHLPRGRQALMFSATQTKRVSDLARLSLTRPDFVSVHETADSATPKRLQQNYVLTPLAEKLDTLWSFLRANLKKKVLVFLSSGKQVRFVYEALRHLQPGVPLLHLHGRQKQTARLDITRRFSASKYACLFSTDVVARGLDFPAVDWVVQVDCPEDADTYIHRVGRTARYEHDGRAILFLDPSEETGMLAALQRKKVVVEKIHVRQKKMQTTTKNQLQNMCFKDPELKYLGQKAFVSYVRGVHIQKDKEIFNVKTLDLEQFASSLGLPGAPRVKFVKGEDAKSRKNAPRQMVTLSSGSEDEGMPGGKHGKGENAVVRTKYDRMFERRNQDVLTEHYSKLIDDKDGMQIGTAHHTTPLEADEEDDFLSVKRQFGAGDAALGAVASGSTDEENDHISCSTQPKKVPSSGPRKSVQLSDKADDELTIDSKRREKMLQSKKKLLKYKGHGSHVHFDDDDVPHEAEYYEREEEFAKEGKPEEQRTTFLESERARTAAADLEDKILEKQKRREKREKRKARERAEEEEEEGEGRVAMLESREEAGPDQMDAADMLPRTTKEQKKWFEDASSGEEPLSSKARRRNRKWQQELDEPQTLEDLEAVAQGLLAY